MITDERRANLVASVSIGGIPGGASLLREQASSSALPRTTANSRTDGLRVAPFGAARGDGSYLCDADEVGAKGWTTSVTLHCGLTRSQPPRFVEAGMHPRHA